MNPDVKTFRWTFYFLIQAPWLHFLKLEEESLYCVKNKDGRQPIASPPKSAKTLGEKCK